MSQTKAPRRYQSERRRQTADDTRRRILDASRSLFSRDGIDCVTVDKIAARAKVATSTIYALFKSKAGILRELMRDAIFSAQYHAAAAQIDGTRDPLALLKLTAKVARTIYENEAREIGLLRGASMFSAELKKLENEFETLRFELQRPRIELLFENALLPDGMSIDAARRIMWMYTSRDVYRMMVVEGGWLPDHFEAWLGDTLIAALVKPATREAK